MNGPDRPNQKPKGKPRRQRIPIDEAMKLMYQAKKLVELMRGHKTKKEEETPPRRLIYE